MNDYIDLVLCEYMYTGHEKIHRAPFASPIKEGDIILVGKWERPTVAKVIAKQSYKIDGDEYNFALRAAGVTDVPERVLYTARPLEYKEG